MRKKHLLFLLPFLMLVLASASLPTVRVGIYHNPPLAFIDNNQPSGFIVDVLERIAEEEGWQLEYHLCEWEACLQALQNDEIDLLAPIAYSDERSQFLGFSEETLLTNWGRVYAQNGTKNLSVFDLEDNAIGLLRGDIHTTAFLELVDDFGVEIEPVYFDDYNDVLRAIEGKQVYAGVLNHIFAMQHLANASVAETSIVFNPVEVRFATAKGENTALLAMLDKNLDTLKRDENSLYYEAMGEWLAVDYSASPVTATWVWWVLGGALLSTLLVLGINHYLRKEVKKRTYDAEQSRTELALIMDRIPEMISFLDNELNYIYADEGYANWYGFQKEELVGKHVKDILPPKNYEKVRPKLLEVVSTGKEIHYSHQILRRDGKKVDVSISYIPKKDAQGNVEAFFATVRDITVEKQAERALIESEAKYRQVVDNALVGITIVQEGKVVFLNQGILNLFNYKSFKELIGQAISDMIAPQDEVRILAELNFVLEGKESNALHIFRALRQDGNVFDAEAIFQFIQYNGKPAVQMMVNNISSRVRAEARFRRLSESSYEAIFISERGVCLEQNITAEKMFGYSDKEAAGRMGTDWIAPEDRDLVLHHMLSGHEEPYRVHALRKDGTTFPAELRGRMMEYDGRKVRVTALRDISYQIHIEEELRASKERFEAIIAKMPIPIGVVGVKEEPDTYNERFTEVFGYKSEDVVDWWQTVYPDAEYRAKVRRSWDAAVAQTRESGKPFETQTRNMVRKDGETRIVEFDIVPLDEFSIIVLNDVTEAVLAEQVMNLRAALAEYSLTHSLEEFLRQTLDEAEVLTDSKIGFYHFVDANHEEISLQQWSSRTVSEYCNVPDLARHYPVSQAGVWAECLKTGKPSIHNDYAALENKQGLPKGHAELVRELVVPVIRGGQVVAILGLGNKPTEYTQQDVALVSQIADICWEISERKYVEEALSESESLLNETQKLARLGSYRFYIHEERWNSNHVLDDIFGINESYNRSTEGWLGLIHSDDRDMMQEYLIEEVLSAKSVFNKHYRIVRENTQETRWVHGLGKLEYDTEGNLVSMVGTIQDVTDRVMAERELQASEQRLRTLINATPDIICFKDGKGRWLMANEADLKLFELSDVDYVGKTDRELAEYSNFYRDAFLAFEDSDELAWQAGRLSRGNEVFSTPELGDKVYDVIKVPLFQKNGAREALVVLGRDITQQVEFQQELQYHVRQLEIVNAISTALSTSLELDDLLKTILQQVVQVVECDSASIFLVQEDQRLRIVYAVGAAEDAIGSSFDLSETLMKKIDPAQKILVMDDAQNDPDYTHWDGEILIRGWMGLSLYARGILVGYLTFDSRQPAAFGASNASLAIAFAPQIAQALYNAQLHKRVIADANELEGRVQKRTEELQRFVDLTTGREIRMIELKDVIRKLRRQLVLAGQIPNAGDDVDVNIAE